MLGQIIDTIDPVTGKSSICQKSLEQLKTEYPNVQRSTVGRFCRTKGKLQRKKVEWRIVSTDDYYTAWEEFPPFICGRGYFLHGEPVDHYADTGEARYMAFRAVYGKHERSSRPMSIREFKKIARIK